MNTPSSQVPRDLLTQIITGPLHVSQTAKSTTQKGRDRRENGRDQEKYRLLKNRNDSGTEASFGFLNKELVRLNPCIEKPDAENWKSNLIGR